MPTDAHPEPAAGPEQTPLSIAWRDWLGTPQWQAGAYCGPAFDAIVIGSGYGGSVAALRLAGKGYRTLLLERGSEYLPGDFPNDFSLVPKSVRINVPGQGLPGGRASGLVEMHLGDGLVALTGNGLGGTSLINAGVVMEPDADVFAQDAWPAPIRHAERGGLAPFFELARAHLGASTWTQGLPGGGMLRKTAALHRLGERLGRAAEPVEITVDPARCVRCGDCASGCNVPGAKKTLASTYLREAVATGRVQVVTQAEVYRFERDACDATVAPPWQVHVFATDAQHQFMATREVFADRQPSATHRALSAPLLFVCAGTLGSTQLLQRSQARSAQRLAFSPTLGTRVSGNGDSLSWVVDEPGVVGSLGRGQVGLEAWERARAGRPFEPAHVTGPTITAKVDLRDRDKALDRRLLVEDGAVPRAIAQLYRELLATGHTLRQLDTWWPRALRHPGAAGEDPLAASDARAQHAQVLLTMGHDGSPARLVWLDGDDRSAPWLPDAGGLETYRRQQRLFDRFGQRHVHIPLWQSLPSSAQKLMSGPKPAQTVTTVHPLGGCAMSDGPDGGVVNHLGQVWVNDPGAFGSDGGLAGGGAQRNRSEPHVYVGLYVLDGAVVPTSLGCNPLLTITALAERALDALPARTPAAPPFTALQGSTRAPAAFASQDVPIDAQLHEVLLARELPVRGALARALGTRRGAARLEATFRAADLHSDMVRASHDLDVRADLWVGPLGADGTPGDAAAHYRAEHGCFNALPAGRFSGGPVVPLLGMLQIALVFGLLGWGAYVLGWRRDGRGAGLLGMALPLLPLLPLWRSVITWALLRGARDIRETLREGFSGSGGWWLYVSSLTKQMLHAGEKRVMRYDIPLQLDMPDPQGRWPQRLVLRATKTVMYRASLGQLLAWLLRRKHRRDDGTIERVPLRPTAWEQVMDAHVRLVAPGPVPRTLARGWFRMGFESLTSSGLAPLRRRVKGPIELGQGGDTTSGLLAAAGYPLLFARLALKTRLLDFRLPSYSGRPLPDVVAAPGDALRVGGVEVAPELHWVDDVPRGTSSADNGDDSTVPLRLPLWRYRQRDGRGHATTPEVVAGRWMGRPVARAKAVLLLHAFGQSGLTFTTRTIRQNLAERLHADGYEVWVLESRMSTRSGYARDPGTADQIAEFDIPRAVDRILDCLRQELPPAVLADGAQLQIAAFAQCIGAAALWMALLSGRLSCDPPAAHADAAPRLSKLSHAMFSQIHPWVVGARATQAKTWVPALLQAVWRRGYVPFAVRGAQDGLLAPLLDRLLGSMPAPSGEDRRPAGNDDAAATCRRIRFIEAPLFRHANIGKDTMAAMPLLFGDASLRLFAQARRFVDRERLVSEDGVDLYVTEENIRRHLAFPVQLLHGRQNELFDVASAIRSFERLRQFHRAWQDRFCAPAGAPASPVLVQGYGHVDVLIGDRADTDVFPQIAQFFDRCHREPAHEVPLPAPGGWVARPPRLGPFVGWLREDPPGQARVRVTFVLDDASSAWRGAPSPAFVLRCRRAGSDRFVSLAPGAVQWHLHEAEAMVEPGGGAGSGLSSDPIAYRVVRADVSLPGDAAQIVGWQVLSLHPSWFDPSILLGSSTPTDAQLDGYIQQFGARSGPEPIEPPVSVGDHDFARAEFELPPASLASLPAGRDVTFAAGCCRYPGMGPDRPRVDWRLAEFLRGVEREPVAFAMLLGDQIYADASAGLVDPSSPLERYYERHTAAFARGGLGDLLAAMPVYMTPDDHEWVDNYPAAGPLVKERWPDWHRQARSKPFGIRQDRAFHVAAKAITAFQRLQSPVDDDRIKPRYGFDHGCTRFHVLDTRYSRQRNEPQIVSDKTLEMLRDWLQAKEAQDALNVIACGSVVLPGLRPGSDPADPGAIDTWQYAQAQRRELLAMLVDLVPGRFLLLSGDYHVSGAVLLHEGGHAVGAAVIAPPLYAPLPYANSTPESVFTQERVDLGGGRTLSMTVPEGGAFERGSGLGLVDVARQGRGLALTYRRDLWVWERGAPMQRTCGIALPRVPLVRGGEPPASGSVVPA